MPSNASEPAGPTEPSTDPSGDSNADSAAGPSTDPNAGPNTESNAEPGAEPEVVRPESLREARDAMLDTRGRTLLIRGAGTAQDWGAPVDPVSVVLETAGLTGVRAYNPADMTVEVGAGMPLAELQAMLAEHGQRVALDAARIDRGATVGGLLATGDGGPLRLRYGTLRELVIGATLVLSDGTVARSGGHVIKNVAGYDLAKLMAGSLGAYALITDLVLRLHPTPEAVGTLSLACPPEDALGYASTLYRSPLEPVALDWHAGRFLARFEGTAASVERRLAQGVRLLDDRAKPSDPPGIETRIGAQNPVWQGIRDTVLGQSGDTVFRAGTDPSLLPALVTRLRRAAAGSAVRADLTSSLAIGVQTVRLTGGDAAQHAAVLTACRDEPLEPGTAVPATEAAGGAARKVEARASVTLHRRIDGLDALVRSWGAPPTYVSVLAALARELDPDNRLAPGRFAGWFGDRPEEVRA